MQKSVSTRRVENMRHYNDQNPNINPARARARAPQMVREQEYTGQLRTIIVSAPAAKPASGAVGRKFAGLPVPVRQAVGRE